MDVINLSAKPISDNAANETASAGVPIIEQDPTFAQRCAPSAVQPPLPRLKAGNEVHFPVSASPACSLAALSRALGLTPTHFPELPGVAPASLPPYTIPLHTAPPPSAAYSAAFTNPSSPPRTLPIPASDTITGRKRCREPTGTPAFAHAGPLAQIRDESLDIDTAGVLCDATTPLYSPWSCSAAPIPTRRASQPSELPVNVSQRSADGLPGSR